MSADKVDIRPGFLSRFQLPKMDNVAKIGPHIFYLYGATMFLWWGSSLVPDLQQGWAQYWADQRYFTSNRISEAETNYNNFLSNLTDGVRAGEFGEELQADLRLIDADSRLKLAYQRVGRFQQEATNNISTGKFGEVLQESQATLANRSRGSRRWIDYLKFGEGVVGAGISLTGGIGIPLFEIWYWGRKALRKIRSSNTQTKPNLEPTN